MSNYMSSTSVHAPASVYAAWVSPTSTCATGAVFGMSKWTDQLAIAPNAAAATRNRKHGRGARAFEDPV
jgi:hypothetical protein